MLDLDALGKAMAAPLESYTGIQKVIEADQEIPPDKLPKERMVYNFIVRTSEPRQSMVVKKDVVASDDPNFEKDIEYSYISSPQVTVSINAYGDDAKQHIEKAVEWFKIDQLGPRFLEDYNTVIANVGDASNRKTFLETDFEDRWGFDVILEIEDTIKVREKTIEQIEITDQDNNTKKYNL